VGILLKRTPEYEARRASLSPERRESLEFEEEEIAADPDQFRAEIEGIRYHRFDYGFIAFRRTGPNEGELIEFRLLDEP